MLSPLKASLSNDHFANHFFSILSYFVFLVTLAFPGIILCVYLMKEESRLLRSWYFPCHIECCLALESSLANIC